MTCDKPYKRSHRSKGFLTANDHVTCDASQNSWLEKVTSQLMPLTTSQAFGTFGQGILDVTFNLTKNKCFFFFFIFNKLSHHSQLKLEWPIREVVLEIIFKALNREIIIIKTLIPYSRLKHSDFYTITQTKMPPFTVAHT